MQEGLGLQKMSGKEASATVSTVAAHKPYRKYNSFPSIPFNPFYNSYFVLVGFLTFLFKLKIALNHTKKDFLK